MKRLAIGLLLAILFTAAYNVGSLFRPTTPAPSVPTAPSEPGTVVCPSPRGVHPALWNRRGAGCPQVTTTMTIGGDDT
jgi:hypothetical protein